MIEKIKKICTNCLMIWYVIGLWVVTRIIKKTNSNDNSVKSQFHQPPQRISWLAQNIPVIKVKYYRINVLNEIFENWNKTC